MGKEYKNKPGCGCAMCKPHKHGWEPKHKHKYRKLREIDEQEMKHECKRPEQCTGHTDEEGTEAGCCNQREQESGETETD